MENAAARFHYGGAIMKEAIKNMAHRMHQCDPQACFAIEFWDGDVIRFGNQPQANLRLRSKHCAARIVRKGFLGFGESYMAGDLEVKDDIAELFRLGVASGFPDLRLPFYQRIKLYLLSLIHRNTQRRASKNISFHYDLSDAFYALFLDSTMAYSCGYFKHPGDTLEQAQLNKYEHIARKLMLEPHDALLDIGCGWGGMLIYAAREYGIRGLGITLSENQSTYANRKIAELGLQDQIAVRYQDYRQVTGKFDKVVSIGMFEHVGKKFIPAFLRKTADLLRHGGMGLLHTIGKDFPSETDPWTVNYIFPGGYIPALPEITRTMGETGLSILDIENLRLHYARTLEKWSQNYERNVARVKEMFDDSFVRRWRLFLYSSAAGFKYGESRLFQVLFSNGLNNALPLTRAHVYAKEKKS